MADRPNIILIITDQQRSDTINALGAPWMKTPTLDRLAREGTAFSNCFVTSPVCVGARASLFRGQYPHATGIFGNFQPWTPSWVETLAEAGYHCASIGKMHINPYDALGGFHQRFPVENKDRPLFLEEHDRAFYDEWDKALKVRRLEKPSRYTRFAADPEGYREAVGCFVWELDEDMHSDMFVGDTALWWLDDRKAESPLFLQIGFPGPHPPYDPSQRYLDLYADADIPLPTVTAEELARQPRAQAKLRQKMVDANFDSVAWRHNVSPDEVLRIRRHYAANVTMIDEKLGQIMDVLRAKGYLDDAVVIFTSDHADALGDHGHIQKWTMYDTVARVPLIFWSPGRIPAGHIDDSLVHLMDVAPTILDYAGVAVPGDFEARSLAPRLSGGDDAPAADVVYAELGRDHIQSGAELIVMRRDRDWKLVYYQGEPDGELFDLNADPDEANNLWTDPDHKEKRDELLFQVQEWLIGNTHRARMPVTRRPQQPMTI
ncbi:MAG: sulfatase-like hydrolase/transferase [Alphaproteobacteria bacterium]|nr:sulfatase-like hydrolase/transferase [Alphaproteobacteria bacterium]